MGGDMSDKDKATGILPSGHPLLSPVFQDERGGLETAPADMEPLFNLISSHEEWLMERILGYAKERGYVEYTSTLKEAWRISIKGLSDSLLAALKTSHEPWELGPNDDYLNDPMATFGIVEAQRHRERGVSLAMFLGLMKYYRQSYLDLIHETGFRKPHEELFCRFVERFFDRVEIAFCVEWSGIEHQGLHDELRHSNLFLANEKNKYLTVFESFPHPVILVDKRFHIDHMNHAAARFFARDAVPGSQYYCLQRDRVLEYAEDETDHEEEGACFHNQHIAALFPWLDDPLKKFVSSSSPSVNFEQEIETSTSSRFFAVNLAQMLDVSEKFRGVVISIEEITEKKRMESAQKLNESRLESLLTLNTMADAAMTEITDFALERAVGLTESQVGYLVFIDDTETELTLYSWSVEAMKQCRMEDRRSVYRIAHTGLWGEAIRQRKAVITNDYGEDNPDKKGYPEGHVPIIRHMNAPLFDGEKIVAVTGVANKKEPYDESDVRQVTLLMNGMWQLLRRKRMEEESFNARKLQSVATLAGGMAHDFNNMLAIIMGNITLGQMEFQSTVGHSCDSLDEAEGTCLQARDLVRSLVTFARGGFPSARRQIFLRDLLEALLDPLAGKSQIRHDLAIPEDLLPIEANPEEIAQVFGNLLANAAQAMPTGGTIRISGANIRDLEWIHSLMQTKTTEALVRISVADEGTGIPNEDLERIFDPYFSTRQRGAQKGMGLGLAIARAIVARYGGKIHVESRVGQGSVFHIYLPAHSMRAE